MRLNTMPARTKAQGFTLVEMMVALLVLAIGLLGMANLTGNSLRVGQTAYAYSQAMFMAQELSEKMLANKANKSLYVIKFGETGDSNVSKDKCIKQACSGADMARWELTVWRSQLAGILPAADAEVTANGDQMAITIRFDASRGKELPEEVVYQVAL